MDFDLTTFAGIVAATTAVIEGLKKMLPDLVKGKEPYIAMLLPLVLGVVSKTSGAFPDVDWANFVTMLLLSGVTSQVAYDKVVLPAKPPKDE